VNSVVESTLILSANRTKNRVEVVKQLNDGLPSVLGNPDELGQVILNLVLNAVDSTPEVGGRIVLRTARAADAVTIEVEDNGSGIPREVQKRLFDPFFTTKKTGTGLGLAISQRLVTDHGGSIEYRTTMNQGTTFRVRLPAMTKPVPAPNRS
jgi:signal transduction histidine kinase